MNISLPIVVEGADGCGKSTLAAMVKEYQPYIKIIHSKGPPTDLTDEITKINHIREKAILDRWYPISEIVYGNILRDQSYRSTQELVKLADQAIAFYQPIIIHCRIPYRFAKQNIDQQIEKNHKSSEKIKKIQENYKKIYDLYDFLLTAIKIQSNVAVTHYDYTEPRAFLSLIEKIDLDFDKSRQEKTNG